MAKNQEVISINNIELVINPTDIMTTQKRRTIEEEYIRENSVFSHMGRYGEANFSILIQFNIDDEISKMDSPNDLPIYLKLLCQLNNFPFLYIKSDRLKRYLTQTSSNNSSEMMFGLESYSLRFSSEANNLITLYINVKYFNYTPLCRTISYYKMTEDGSSSGRTKRIGGKTEKEYSPERLDSIFNCELFDRYFQKDYVEMFNRLKPYQNKEEGNTKYIGQTKVRSPQFFNEEPESGVDFKKVTITEIDDNNNIKTGYIYAVWRDFGEFSVIGDDRSPITSITISRYNNFASHSMTGWAYPVLQYMGKGATRLDMQFSENSLDGYSLSYLKTMIGQLDVNQLDNYKYSQYNNLKIDNVVVDLMPMFGFILDTENITSSSKMQEVDNAFFSFKGKDLSRLLEKREHNTANTRSVKTDSNIMMDAIMNISDKLGNDDSLCTDNRIDLHEEYAQRYGEETADQTFPVRTGRRHRDLNGTSGFQNPGEWPTGLSEEKLADIERRNNIPPGLMYNIMMKESGGQMYLNGRLIRSHMGAGGVFQIMPGTAALLHVENVDDPVEAAEGAGRLLKSLSTAYNGDVNLILAAYNRGQPNLDRTIRAAGTNNWDAIKNHPTMPSETTDYVAKIGEWYAADTGQTFRSEPECYGNREISIAQDQVYNVTEKVLNIFAPEMLDNGAGTLENILTLGTADLFFSPESGFDMDNVQHRRDALYAAKRYLERSDDTREVKNNQLLIKAALESTFVRLNNQASTGNKFLAVGMRGTDQYLSDNHDRLINSFEGEAYGDLELGERLGLNGLLSEEGGLAGDVRDINPMFFMDPHPYIKKDYLSLAYNRASAILMKSLLERDKIRVGDSGPSRNTLSNTASAVAVSTILGGPTLPLATYIYGVRSDEEERERINRDMSLVDSDIEKLSSVLNKMILYDTNKGSSITVGTIKPLSGYSKINTDPGTDKLKAGLVNIDINKAIKNTPKQVKIDKDSQENARGTYPLDLVKQGVGNEDQQAEYHFPRGCQPFNRGINQAFPVIKVYLVEGDEDSIRYNLSSPEPEYYELSGLVSVKIAHQDDESPVDVAAIRIANPGSVYTDHTVYMDLVRPKKNWALKDTPAATSIPLDKVTLRSGNRIHIKGGYSNDINKLEPMFNGIITEVHGEATLDLICESYGRELIAYEHGTDPENDAFWGGADTIEVISNFIYSGEIEHFGNIKLLPSLLDSEGSDRAKFTLNNMFSSFGAEALWMNIYIDDVVDGKYDYGFHPIDTFGTDKKWFPFFPIYKQTPWGAFKEMEFRHPGSLARASLYGPRQTIFYGIKEQLYVFRDLHKAMTSTKSYIRPDKASDYLRDERLKPISDVHILSSDHNIISNTLKVKSDFNTVVEVAYYESNWDIDEKDFKYYEIKMDDNLKPMAHRKGYCNMSGIHGLYSCYVYGSTYLRKEAEKMYDGRILILGNQNVKSGDYAYLDDSARGLSGIIKIRECIQHFDTENGFVTEIRPALYAESSHSDYSTLFSKLHMTYSHVVNAARLETRKANKSNDAFAKSAAALDLMGLSNYAEDSTDFLHLASEIFTKKGAYIVADTGGIAGMSYLLAKGTARGFLNTPGKVGSAARATKLALEGSWAAAKFGFKAGEILSAASRPLSAIFATARTGFQLARGYTPAGWAATIALTFVTAKIEEVTLTRQPIRMFPLIMNGKPYQGGMWGYQEDDFWSDFKHNTSETWDNVEMIYSAITS
ncbi:MAG: hypothetical protein DRQ78_00890 [Epsilonproteobacteria bacterium]|nr:MAG: hypothetical protein DRQ78_00890 [Campylobacterota bacterium]